MPDEHKEDSDAPEYFTQEEQVWKELDPVLQRIVIGRQARRSDPLSVSEKLFGYIEAEAVDVIAKLHDPKKEVEGLHVVERIGQIVTGTVDADKIEDVRRDPNVISLKGARRLQQTLANSVPEIQASRQQLRQAFPDDPKTLDGSNVIVGIIDHGCGFAHPNFRKPDAHIPGGATRVLYLWDQRGGPNQSLPAGGGRSPDPYGYGREFNCCAINKALTKAPPEPSDPEAPYRYLNYVLDSEHGTAVMDIAAGNGGGGLHAPGVAPSADIIFVEESGEDPFLTGDPLGNTRRLLEAVKYIFDKAQGLGRPAVVNISLSSRGGPHDGTTLIEEGFDRLLETPGRAIVISAGNLRLHPIHIRRMLPPRRTRTLRWCLVPDPDKKNNNKIDFWYDGRRALSLILRSPSGNEFGPFPLDSTYAIYRNGRRAALVFHRANDPTNGDNNLVILFSPHMETGVWELDLRLLDDVSHLPMEVHAWTVTDHQPSTFPDALASDCTSTLNPLGCGHSTIVVGGYNQLDPDHKLEASGEGPTRDGKLKPEVSAPAVEITVAQAKTTLTRIFGATSAAAPHVTGIIALLMQSVPVHPFIDQIREFVINTARDDPPSPEHGWDTCYGAGRVCAVAAVQALRQAMPLPADMMFSQPLFICPAIPAKDVNDEAGAAADVEGVGLAATCTKSVAVSAMTTPGMEVADNSLAGMNPSAAVTETGIANDDEA